MMTTWVRMTGSLPRLFPDAYMPRFSNAINFAGDFARPG
jgi:hypothetical protein